MPTNTEAPERIWVRRGTSRAENERLRKLDAQSRASGCWCDEYGHPCKACSDKQELSARLAEAEAKRKSTQAEWDALMDRIWKALGIETYEQAKPYDIAEHVARLKEAQTTQRDAAEEAAHLCDLIADDYKAVDNDIPETIARYCGQAIRKQLIGTPVD